MGKLTGRTELAEAPADGDLIHVVDVSDTTDNAAGTSKKITAANLLANATGDVSAAAVMTDNTIIKGDGGAKGVQDTGISIDDSDNVTGVAEITVNSVPIFDTIAHATPTGIVDVDGGILSINADATKFDISDGCGYIVDQFTDPDNPTMTKVTWSSLTANTTTYLATDNNSYVLIDSGGSIVQQNTAISDTQRRTHIALGALIHTGNTAILATADQSSTIVDGYLSEDIALALGDINVYGHNYSAASTDLTIRREAGRSFSPNVNRNTDTKDPHFKTASVDASVTFTYVYDDGSAGITGVVSQTDIDPDQYDDGSGTLASVDNNKWTNQALYYFPNSGVQIVRYGDTVYNSLAGAESAIPSLSYDIIGIGLDDTYIRTILTVKKGTTDLSSADAVFTDTGKFGLGGGAGLGQAGTFQDMQDTYDNSTTPEILTDSTRGAVSIKRGSAADSDDQLEVLNAADSQVFGVTAEGNVAVSGTVDGRDIAADGTTLDDLPVSNLADGTDGELITWDAAGAPATVPVGTATHVLTSNGAGAAPTFQAAAGGGGGNPYNADLVVAASGGDYTTLGEAVANASADDVIYLEPGSYTETANRTGTVAVHVIGSRAATVVLDAYTLTFGAKSVVEGFSVSKNGVGYMYNTGEHVTYKDLYASVTTTSSYVIRANGAYSRIQGINIDTATAGTDILLYTQTNYSSIADCVITIVSGKANTPVVKALGQYSTISNVQLESTTYVASSEGIEFGSTYGTMTGCSIKGYFSVCYEVSAGNAAVSGNSVVCYGSNGIGFRLKTAGVAVTGNSAYAQASGVATIQCTSGSMIISGNNLRGYTSTRGVLVDNGDDNVVITGNLIWGHGNAGVTVAGSSSDNVTIVSNLMTSNTTDIDDSGTNTFYQTATDSDALNQIV